jgi:hypothetical protein
MLPVLLIFAGLGTAAALKQESARTNADCYRRGLRDAMTAVAALHDAAQVVDEEGLVVDPSGMIASVRDLRPATRRATVATLQMLEHRAKQLADAPGRVMGSLAPPVGRDEAYMLVAREAQRPSRADWYVIRDAAKQAGASVEQIRELRRNWRKLQGKDRRDGAALLQAADDPAKARERVVGWIETRLDKMQRRRSAKVRAQVGEWRKRLAILRGSSDGPGLARLAVEVREFVRQQRRRRRRFGARVGRLVKGAVRLPGKIVSAPFRKRRRRKPRRPTPRIRMRQGRD